jgi:hypothetical protein
MCSVRNPASLFVVFDFVGAVDFKAKVSNFSDTSSTSHAKAQASSSSNSAAKTSSASAAHGDHGRNAHSESGEDSGADSDGSDILEGCKRRRRHRLDDSDDEDRVRRKPREGSLESGEESGHVEYEKKEDVVEKLDASLNQSRDSSIVVDRAREQEDAAAADKKRIVREPAATTTTTQGNSFAGVVDVKLLRNEITRLRNLNHKVLLEFFACSMYVSVASSSTQVSNSWLRSDICNDSCMC